MVKKLLILSSLFVASFLGAQSIKLAWDASPSSGVASYRLYAHTNNLATTSLSNAVVKLSAGTNLTATVSNLVSGKWWFAATAVNALGIESDMSNVLLVEIPAAPSNMRTIVAQWNGQVVGTNWVDVGFFRIKMGD